MVTPLQGGGPPPSISAESDDEPRIGDKWDKYLEAFQKLMPHRIREILLVASPYDSYLIEEDGLIYEQIRREYHGLNLIHAPEVTQVSSAFEALDLLKTKRFDMVITTLHIKDMHAVRFARAIRNAEKEGHEIPIVLLAYDNNERKSLVSSRDAALFDEVFIWQGDYRLLVAIIKCIEDRLNVSNDTELAGVQSIILIENNVRFYSLYLPIIYTEIFKQSQRLIAEGVNLTHRYVRMRARPKILLATNYDEAWEYFEKYSEDVLGVISDINFRRSGVKDPQAGLHFTQAVKKQYGDIPVLLQSSSDEFEARARELGATFVKKDSPRLLHELQEFIVQNFGFGDFIFRLPDGRVVGRAAQLKTFVEQVRQVPIESIEYHAERNHFSNWLKARTEFELAHQLRPKQAKDYSSSEELRDFLVTSIEEYLKLRTRGIIMEFEKETFDVTHGFARIGGGSLGGKARGLGFVNSLINLYRLEEYFKNVRIHVPSAVVLGTEVFDQFILENDLFSFAMSCDEDAVILKKFLEAPIFPQKVTRKLVDYLSLVTVPLAVRSSSLLEDSQYQPFAGVYETYMLPNHQNDSEVRLQQLLLTVRKVYASMFFKKAKDYIRATDYRLEEEKMAVMIQTLVGSVRGGRFYPDFSGVAKSHNFYPVYPQKASDGIANVALGLGKMVVDGGASVRFCHKYPKHIMQFFSTQETLRTAQQEFYALKMDVIDSPQTAEDLLIGRYTLQEAERDGTLAYCGSTYSYDNNVVYDGISREGLRLVTFAPILKHEIFPLPEILNFVLELGSWSMGSPVEIEFAVNMATGEFGLLQVRPLVLNYEMEELNVESYTDDKILVKSQQVLGNGVRRGIQDIIVVDIETFERSESRQVAQEVSHLNATLVREKRPYLLIGVGRWGTLDPWLGIPVTWDQISGAVAIVESSFKDFEVTPSQGSHFFQNLTSFKIGYFTVNSRDQSFIRWEWLRSAPAFKQLQYARHIRLDQPLSVLMNGHRNIGVITLPGVMGVGVDENSTV